jgi:hypothetical protein
MENLKIKINSEAESKEAQELFFALGYGWSVTGKSYLKTGTGHTHLTAYEDGLLSMGFGDAEIELTIHQLRDLVVLHRNDFNDANHTDQNGRKWFLTSRGEGYVFAAGNAENIKRWDKSSLDYVYLKPITKIKDQPTSDAEQIPKSENRNIDATYNLLDGESAKKAWVNGSKIQISPIQDIPEWEDLNEKIATLDCFQKKWLFRCKPLTIMINGTELKPWNSVQVNYETFQIKIDCIDAESADQSYKAIQKIFCNRSVNWSNN